MIKPGTLAFDEVVMCAFYQGVFKPIECGDELWVDLIDYLKIKDLEW